MPTTNTRHVHASAGDLLRTQFQLTRKTSLALEDSEHRLQDHSITELDMLTLNKNPAEAK